MSKEKMTAEEIAQWAVDNRHSKGEGRDKSDHEIYHHLRDSIEAYAQQQNGEKRDEVYLKEELSKAYQAGVIENTPIENSSDILQTLEELKSQADNWAENYLRTKQTKTNCQYNN